MPVTSNTLESDIPTPPANRAHVILGVAAGVATACIGSTWQILSRHSVTTTIAPLDLALLRYLVPALVLLPLTVRIGLFPQGVARLRLALMVVCGGLPFLLLVLTGARLAPVAHLGVMLSGAMPLFTAALAVLVLAQRVSFTRAAGLLLILCGVVTLGAGSLATQGAQTWLGDVLFLLASLVWAIYGLAFRSSGLTSWEAVAVVSAWSAIIVVSLGFATGFGSLPSAPVADLLTQVIVQGVLAGLLGTVLYNYSIKQLGAQAATSFSALTPVLSALGGAAFLAERLSFTGIVAVTLASLGVLLASGIAFPRRA